MTTTEKIAVSLPKPIAERARRAARRRSGSLSAYVARALEEKVKLDDLSSLLEEMLEETGGPLTRTERKAADKELGFSARRRKKG